MIQPSASKIQPSAHLVFEKIIVEQILRLSMRDSKSHKSQNWFFQIYIQSMSTFETVCQIYACNWLSMSIQLFDEERIVSVSVYWNHGNFHVQHRSTTCVQTLSNESAFSPCCGVRLQDKTGGLYQLDFTQAYHRSLLRMLAKAGCICMLWWGRFPRKKTSFRKNIVDVTEGKMSGILGPVMV